MSPQQTYEKGFLPVTGYIRQSQLIPEIIPVSSATFWRMVKAGEFPQPVKLSERCTAWKVEDIRAWIKSKDETHTGKMGE